MDLESVHLRCPHCQKLFIVARSEIKSNRPEFQCDSCSTRFYMPFPQATDKREFQTFFMNPAPTSTWRSIEEKHSKFACPYCQALNDKGSTECATCERVFEKAKKISVELRKEFLAPEPLRLLWEDVMKDFGNEVRHEAFIQEALSTKALPYASQQYRQILDGNPNEQTAIKMQQRIINLTTLTYVPPLRQKSNVAKKSISMPLLLVGFGVLLTATGFAFAQLRSIISVGAVIMTLGVGFMAVAKRSTYED